MISLVYKKDLGLWTSACETQTRFQRTYAANGVFMRSTNKIYENDVFCLWRIFRSRVFAGVLSTAEVTLLVTVNHLDRYDWAALKCEQSGRKEQTPKPSI